MITGVISEFAQDRTRFVGGLSHPTNSRKKKKKSKRKEENPDRIVKRRVKSARTERTSRESTILNSQKISYRSPLVDSRKPDCRLQRGHPLPPSSLSFFLSLPTLIVLHANSNSTLLISRRRFDSNEAGTSAWIWR